MIRNPKYNANGTIDCELEHPHHGWVWFTADPDDVEEHGRFLFDEIKSGKYGQIAEYVPPETEETDEAE